MGKGNKQKKKTKKKDIKRRPVHILVECPELIASVKVGVLEPLQPLVSQSKCDVRFIRTLKIKKDDLNWSDIFVSVRGSDPITKRIVSIAKKARRLIIYYLDDDLLNVPQESTVGTYYADSDVRENIISILGMSDILWGVNKKIRDKYLPYTKGRWIENKVPVPSENFLNTKIISYDPIRILYAGSRDHEKLIREVLTGVVQKIAKEYQDTVEFVFLGADPGIKGMKNVSFHAYFDLYEDYRKFIENGNFSIGLAPGRDDPFYASKYYNKFVEYASIGAVGIFSNVEPYTQIVVNNENGFLCDNTFEQWYETLIKLIKNKTLITDCRRIINKQIHKEFEPKRIADNLLIQCPEFGTYYAKTIITEEIQNTQTYLQYWTNRAMIIWRAKKIHGIPEITKKIVRIFIKIIRKEII